MVCVFLSLTSLANHNPEGEAYFIGPKEVIDKVNQESKKLFNPGDVPCSKQATDLINKVNPIAASLVIRQNLTTLGEQLDKIRDDAAERGEPHPIDQGLFRTREERVIQVFSNTKTANDFAKALTGEQNLGDIKDMEELKKMHKHLDATQRAFTKLLWATTKGKTDPNADCEHVATIHIGTPRLSFPFLNWAGVIDYKITCKCGDNSDNTQVNTIHHRVTFTMRSSYTTYKTLFKKGREWINVNRSDVDFQQPGNFRVVSTKVTCCASDADDGSGSYLQPPTTGNDSENAFYEDFLDNYFAGLTVTDEDLANVIEEQANYGTPGANGSGIDLPLNFVNAGLGLGYDGKEDELGVCVQFGYFRQLTECEKASLYLGGYGHVDYNTQVGSNVSSDFSQTQFLIGPKAEMYFPLGDGPVALKTGLGGGFGIGNQKWSDFKEKQNIGFFEVTTGVSIFCGCIIWCFEMPVFQFEHIKVRDDFSDFSENNIGFNLNKKMPFKLSVAVPFGDKDNGAGNGDAIIPVSPGF